MGRNGRLRATQRLAFALALTLTLAACGDSNTSDADQSTGASSTAPGPTQASAVGAGPQCRAALDQVDAYAVAKQANRTDVADPATARQSCLASAELPPQCREAMSNGATMATSAPGSVEFFAALTAYRESSTLCRTSLLRSI